LRERSSAPDGRHVRTSPFPTKSFSGHQRRFRKPVPIVGKLGKRCATIRGLSECRLPTRAVSSSRGTIAAYHAEVGHPVVRLLICDDAKQFKLVTEELGLCWIHDGRHYKNLEPWVDHHRQLLDAFLKRYWEYYKELLAYRQQPSAEEAMRLSGAFDELFSTVTGYAALDQRIAKTQANKGQLPMVLRHPEIPLHNNPAELGARAGGCASGW